ncbi:MAG: hypothetical protein H7Y03_10305 [Chitinophagaceae bacterium]|nr:hypothetical protein [Chitinophagaceae bacterium]
MKAKIIGSIALIIFIVACSKDKFQSKPTLELKSIGEKTVPLNGTLKIELEYTDKEGDIAGDTILVFKVRNNLREAATLVRPVLDYLLPPETPNKRTGVIELIMANRDLVASDAPIENDSLTMRFVLKDNASNVSDTLDVEDIVITRR